MKIISIISTLLLFGCDQQSIIKTQSENDSEKDYIYVHNWHRQKEFGCPYGWELEGKEYVFTHYEENNASPQMTGGFHQKLNTQSSHHGLKQRLVCGKDINSEIGQKYEEFREQTVFLSMLYCDEPPECVGVWEFVQEHEGGNTWSQCKNPDRDHSAVFCKHTYRGI